MVKKSDLTEWVEGYFYNPSLFQRILSFFLLPLTLLYCLGAYIRRRFCKAKDYGIAVVSVGNLLVGGSGKTPFVIELAKRYGDCAVILRGYGRKSSGMVVVSERGQIKTDVKTSGDEAMLIAKSLPQASVIVSEKREDAIGYAKEKGIKVVFLDDGFGKCHIKKLDILLKPETDPKNGFCLPSGPYREPKSFEKYAHIVAREGEDFRRIVNIENKTENMVLITAIAKPQRLDRYLPENIEKFYFADHHYFEKEEIGEIVKKTGVDSILTTQKDEVKLEKFGFKLSVMRLKMDIDEKILEKVDKYIKERDAKKDTDSSDPS
ncbi:tetraacyldisaccharide 4'-kinase [Nitrosophilus alvini]|uniref:tetraacyldisaccharide 4'-kinase n=1 Tax=Nitrosophilus alvini TaxID=2714855 RepID=UPI001909557C|nr:tetraacyldisaccharide 4'-kinase [Nitrosophilus alvini]